MSKPRFVAMMALTLYALMEQLSEMDRQIEAERTAALELARTPGSDMAAVRTAQQRVSDLEERRKILDAERARMEAASKARMERQNGNGTGADMSFEEAAGMYFRSVMADGDVRAMPQMAYEQLGVIPEGSADQGNGSALVPKHLSDRLLLAPKVKNPLRARMVVTAIPGLELPKLDFSLEDDSFLSKDGESARELAISGDTIAFGRHKVHLIAKVSETVLRSTPLDIEGAVFSALDSALSAKELSVMFATAPKTGAEHMSFYQKVDDKYVVPTVTGSDLLDTIIKAFGDLEDAYQDDACCVMRRQDYYAEIRKLANSEALFGKKPEDVIGYPVVFCEKATIPVVGDLGYLQENFDAAPWLDSDKDVKAGVRLMTETCLMDIKRRMNAAFRLVIVGEAA